jgi:hypothetical protein
MAFLFRASGGSHQPTGETTMLNKFDNASPHQIIEAMAEGMRRIGDGCTRNDLKLLGFSEMQIENNSDQARELAMAKAHHSIRSRVPARRAA